MTERELVDLVVPAALGLGSTIVVTVISWLWAQHRKRLDEQAKLLADAYAAVAAYKEFPFAVRRRDHHEPAKERVRISEAMRAVQQDLTFHVAWVRGAPRRVSEAYDNLVGEVRKIAGSAIREAWNTPAITTDEQMNMPEVGAQVAALAAPEQDYLAEVQRYLHPWRYRFRRIRRD